MKQITHIANTLVLITEKFLTYRARKKIKILQQQQQRGMLLDWFYSFLWAVGVVLLLNQYLLQGYLIPSGSMIPTLRLEDKIFVNKLVYGPEVLPGFIKIPPIISPKRFDVVVFESPDYISRGTMFEVLQRVLYMLTLGKVDINRNKLGQPKVQFLIKRLIAMEGDTLKLVNGQMFYKLAGTNNWYSESQFREVTGATFFENNPELSLEEVNTLATQYTESLYRGEKINKPYYTQFFDLNRSIALHEYELNPTPLHSNVQYAMYKNGWYVADNKYFFMGDNRDNSLDSRYYSGVPERRVLGKAFIIYWPFKRLTLIR